MRMFVGRLGMLCASRYAPEPRRRALSPVVLAEIVMVGGLMMMMCGCVVMSRRLMMMFAGRMLGELAIGLSSQPVFET